MSGPIYVLATGCRTPLGLHSTAAAAAVRAAISSCSEHPFMLDQTGAPVAASLDSTLDPQLSCSQRILTMARTALQEACAPVQRNLTLPLLLGVPEPRPGFTEEDAHRICQQLADNTELPITIGQRCASMAGHSAVLSLVHQAMTDMAEGKYHACLVGGADSYFHPDTIAWLDQNRQLNGPISRSGFVPGEGAGFCLLANQQGVMKLALPPISTINSCATQWEPKLIKTQEINLGEGLTQTLREALQNQNTVAAPINGVYCDVNGERYRGEEWGFACLKLAQHFEDPSAYCSPADCWGDMGAASGALYVTLATQAAQRGYATGPRNLLWTSSEQGLRAAAVIEADVASSPYRA